MDWFGGFWGGNSQATSAKKTSHELLSDLKTAWQTFKSVSAKAQARDPFSDFTPFLKTLGPCVDSIVHSLFPDMEEAAASEFIATNKVVEELCVLGVSQKPVRPLVIWAVNQIIQKIHKPLLEIPSVSCAVREVSYHSFRTIT